MMVVGTYRKCRIQVQDCRNGQDMQDSADSLCSLCSLRSVRRGAHRWLGACTRRGRGRGDSVVCAS